MQTALASWKRTARIALPIAAASLIAILFRGMLLSLFGILFGAGAIAFLLAPMVSMLERYAKTPVAVLIAILFALGAAALFLWAMLPPMIRQTIALVQSLPESIQAIKTAADAASDWLLRHASIELPPLTLGEAALPSLASGTMAIAGNIADATYRISLMVILAYFLLCDRKRLMIRAELLVPLSARKTFVRMGNAISRELRLYLRGQMLIALAVGMVAFIGLFAIGLDSALVLGAVVGLLNMIPYFGPVLGGIPAMLSAFGYGWKRALMTAFVLWLVQQIDGTLISPRILGNVSGLSPATVLIALFVGSYLGGILGMLLALPVLMTIRTAFRVYAQRNET